jgi:hypothetical protein
MDHCIPSLFSLCVDALLYYNKLSKIILYCFQFSLPIEPIFYQIFVRRAWASKWPAKQPYVNGAQRPWLVYRITDGFVIQMQYFHLGNYSSVYQVIIFSLGTYWSWWRHGGILPFIGYIIHTFGISPVYLHRARAHGISLWIDMGPRIRQFILGTFSYHIYRCWFNIRIFRNSSMPRITYKNVLTFWSYMCNFVLSVLCCV